jgi:predicted  nucleic acid-binding Zn-ribbon protein
MATDETKARALRKMRNSRGIWKARAEEKQQQIRRLRVNLRDVTASRDHWKSRTKELEEQVRALEQAKTESLSGRSGVIFLGG